VCIASRGRCDGLVDSSNTTASPGRATEAIALPISAQSELFFAYGPRWSR